MRKGREGSGGGRSDIFMTKHLNNLYTMDAKLDPNVSIIQMDVPLHTHQLLVIPLQPGST